MKKILFILVVLFILTAGITGCEREVEKNEAPNVLMGTKWKLTGIVDTETNEVIEPEPADCEKCYTFTFNTDNTASGYSVGNIVIVNLKRAPYIGVATEVYDHKIGNASLFYEAIEQIASYSHEKDELKFYYDNSRNYLLFKLQKR
jgi:hypothetical protein